jgi:thiol:disulfide interchange protein DsbA
MCRVIAFACPALGELILGDTQDSLPFSSYGNGKVVIRVYTDYFCNPCRSAEPEIELLLVNLVKLKKITVTFVETPVYKDSQIYKRFFLYAINKQINLNTPSEQDLHFLRLPSTK